MLDYADPGELIERQLHCFLVSACRFSVSFLCDSPVEVVVIVPRLTVILLSGLDEMRLFLNVSSLQISLVSSY